MLNTRYIPINTFQEIFLDKDTSCPLAAGVVKFFEDDSRTTAKEVFILSGTPPNYSYVSIGAEVDLSSSGTFEYDGSDVTVYLYPYDDSGTIQLYYATVESYGGTPQITREGFPNISAADDVEEEITNYIPNGQFLLHHDIVADPDGSIEAGQITDDVTVIAEGGWTFERPSGSTATDFVLFERFGSYVENPTGSPRYSIRIKTTVPGSGDTFKDIRIKFKDVNKFSSNDEFFTLGFSAKSNSGSAIPLNVKMIKNYGTGGDPEESIILEQISLTTDYILYDIPFTFGSNSGKTIGNNDDDFIQLVISCPVAIISDLSISDAILTDGAIQLVNFPSTPDEDFARYALAGQLPVPNYEGENLYLPVILGEKGLEYDTSSIGNYVLKSKYDLSNSELPAEGQKYRIAAYSSTHIPYRRLYEAWVNDSTNFYSGDGLPLYGPGQNEMRMVLAMNTAPESTAFNSNSIFSDAYQSYTATSTAHVPAVEISFLNTTGTFDIYAYKGDGTSGELLAIARGLQLNAVTGFYRIHFGEGYDQETGEQYTIRLKAPGSSTFDLHIQQPGSYAGGSLNGGADDAAFKIFSTAPTDKYFLESTTVGAVTAAADGAVPTGFTFTPLPPNPAYTVQITFKAASTVAAGSYWTYHTTDNRKYLEWYKKDGIGTQPVESADVYREVDIDTSDTAIQVANKSAIATNSYSLGIPDWRGRFIQVPARKSTLDPLSGRRTGGLANYGSNMVGTSQEVERNTGDPNPSLSFNKYATIAIKY